jgi:DNA-directed RNA polymerase specialized sigma24 family protein
LASRRVKWSFTPPGSAVSAVPQPHPTRKGSTRPGARLAGADPSDSDGACAVSGGDAGPAGCHAAEVTMARRVPRPEGERASAADPRAPFGFPSVSVPPDSSVTLWLEQLKAGDPAAAKPLWDCYFARLVALARARLRSAGRTAADEEDVALSAFDSFCRGAEAGRFPQLGDRDDLWQVLFLLTTRKVIGLVRRETRAKRGGQDRVAQPADAVVAADPTPEFAAEVAEECERLLGLLRDGRLREVAVWKMEGYTNVEIAEKLGRSVPTVERKLAAIRAIWERDAGP